MDFEVFSDLPMFWSDDTKHLLTAAIMIVVFWQVGIWLSAAATGLLLRKQRRAQTGGAVASSLGVIGFIPQVAIWSKLLRRLAQLEVEFAYPTQTLYVVSPSPTPKIDVQPAQ